MHIIHLEITLNNSNEFKFRNFLFAILFYLIFTGCLQPLCLSGTYGTMLPFRLKTTSFLKKVTRLFHSGHETYISLLWLQGMLVASPQRYCGVKWGNAVPLGISGTNYNNDGDSGGGSGDEKWGKQWHQHREAPQECNSSQVTPNFAELPVQVNQLRWWKQWASWNKWFWKPPAACVMVFLQHEICTLGHTAFFPSQWEFMYAVLHS